MNLLSLLLESLLPLSRARHMIKVAIVVACCGLCSSIPAVSPATDGRYPNNNTAESADALFNLTPGVGNTATASALSMSPTPRANPQPSKFVFKDASGKAASVDVIQSYQSTKIVRPFATADRQLDPKLMHAATIAEERAHAHSRRQCWHAVKEALLASGVISSRPKTEYAKQAGQELVNNYGFRKLPVNDPYQAPVGSVLVYNANRAAGHVEIRTKDGFVSDFRSKTPSHRPLLGVFVKS
jgi:hypothetical protein